jgi:hypothetical protein
VRFRRSKSGFIKSASCIVWVDPVAIFAYWRDDGWYQRSPNVRSYDHDLPFDGQLARLAGIARMIKNDEPLPPVSISWGDGPRAGLCFPDGRHRIVLLASLGYSSIPAEIPVAEKPRILALVGASTRDSRVRLVRDQTPDFARAA